MLCYDIRIIEVKHSKYLKYIVPKQARTPMYIDLVERHKLSKTGETIE